MDLHKWFEILNKNTGDNITDLVAYLFYENHNLWSLNSKKKIVYLSPGKKGVGDSEEDNIKLSKILPKDKIVAKKVGECLFNCPGEFLMNVSLVIKKLSITNPKLKELKIDLSTHLNQDGIKFREDNIIYYCIYACYALFMNTIGMGVETIDKNIKESQGIINETPIVIKILSVKEIVSKLQNKYNALKKSRFANLEVDDSLISKLVPIDPQKEQNQPSEDHRTEKNICEILYETESKFKDKPKCIYLTADGGMGKTTMLWDLMVRKYGMTIDETSPNEEKAFFENAVPFLIELSAAPSSPIENKCYDINESRERVSTFIRRSLYQQIVPETDKKKAYTADIEIIKNVTDQLFDSFTENQYLLLMLDGINELPVQTIDNPGSSVPLTPRNLIQKEIAELLHTSEKVRCIVTGRTDEQFSLKDVDIETYHLLPLDEEKIIQYLETPLNDLSEDSIKRKIINQKIKAVRNDRRFLETLSNPMFLTLYAQINNTTIPLSSRGEIFKAYYHTSRIPLKDEYTTPNSLVQISEQEKSRRTEILNKDIELKFTAEMAWLVLDVILPEIAYAMGESQSITAEDAQKMVIDLVCEKDEDYKGKWFFTEGDFSNISVQQAFPQYYSGSFEDEPVETEDESIETTVEKIRNNKLQKIVFDYCIKNLGILIRTGTRVKGSYSFRHQHMRDYFRAVKIVNNFRVANALFGGEIENQNDAYACLAAVLGEKPLSAIVRAFVGEYLGEHHNMPHFDQTEGQWKYAYDEISVSEDRKLIDDLLDVCRGRDEDDYVVYNLVSILKEVRGDLSGVNFGNKKNELEFESGIDLRKCSLNGVPLSKPGQPGLKAKFDGAKVDRENLFPMGHTSKVTSVVYHPDLEKHTLLTASTDGTIKLWDTVSGLCRKTLYGHTDSVMRLIFNPDNTRYFASASKDGSVRIWDCDTYDCVDVLHDAIGSCFELIAYNNIAYNNNGAFIATISSNSSIKLWNKTQEGKYKLYKTLRYKKIENTYCSVNYIQFHPITDQLLTWWGGRYLRVWSHDTIWSLDTYDYMEREIDDFDTISDEKEILDYEFVDYEEYIKEGLIFDYSKYIERQDETKWDDHTVEIYNSYNSESAKYAEEDETLEFDENVDENQNWDDSNTSDTEEYLDVDEYPDNEYYVDKGSIQSVSYNPNGTQIIISAFHRTRVLKLDSETLNPIPTLIENPVDYISDFHYSTNGKVMVTTGYTPELKICDLIAWNSINEKEIMRIAIHYAYSYQTLCFSPNDRYIAISRESKPIIDIYDLLTGSICLSLMGVHKAVLKAEYKPDGTGFITTSLDGIPKIWSFVSSHNMLSDFECKCDGVLFNSDLVETARFNPDPNTNQIVTAGKYGDFRIWDEKNLISRRHLCLYNEAYSRASAQYCIDGTILIINNSRFYIWDYKGKRVCDTKCKASCVADCYEDSAEFNAKILSKYLLCYDKYLVLLDASEDKIIRAIEGTELEAKKRTNLSSFVPTYESAVFSSDTTLILTAQTNGLIELWDNSLLTRYDSVYAHSVRITSVNINSDNTYVISSSGDHTIKLWKIEDKKLIEKNIVLEGHEGWVRTAVFSPDDMFILSASDDGTCKIWDAHTHECLCTVENIPGLFVQGVDFTKLAETNLDEEDLKKLRMYGADIFD